MERMHHINRCSALIHGQPRDWAVLGLSLGLLVLAGCTSMKQSSTERFEYTQPHMGLPFRIVLYASDRSAADAAAAAAFDRIQELNDILSDYDMDSELSKLSHSSGQGKEVELGRDLWAVLEQAQRLAQRSAGAFDITVGPCVNLWRKARREKRLPQPAQLADAREAVGHEKLRLDPRHHTAQLTAPGMRLDLGGIAKGYAVDEALKILRARGVSQALVAGGGDMAVSGPPPGQKGWRIEIAPLDVTNAPPARFAILAHGGLATSGDVFQHLEIDGKRYSHIVDPHTCVGLTDHSLVTIIARDCTTADGLATAVSVLGPERGLDLVERTSGAAAHIVRKPGEQIERLESKRFKRFYESVLP